MADKQKKVVKEGPKDGAKGNLLKVIIIVLLVAMLVGGGIFAGYFVAAKMTPTTITKVVKTDKVLNPKSFSLGEDFLVNIKSEKSSGFLKTKIYIGYDGELKEHEDLPAELEEKKPMLRDSVNSILRSKKPEDFDGTKDEQLKKEIKDKINTLLTKGKVEDVYFYEIIVQEQ
jgi:flagellar basal body-associated protein FliL